MSKLLYLPELDGLRAIAFLLVLVSHFPVTTTSSTLKLITIYAGEVGVNLFFVISTYLFFTILPKEWDARGRISVRDFIIRRLLRIYPLLFVFVLGSVVIYGTTEYYRAVSILLLIDSIVLAMTTFSYSVLYTGHFWTLSVEFQVYLLIPAALILLKRIGMVKFAWAIAAVFIYCLALRFVFFKLQIGQLAFQALSFLSPEPFLVGIALATFKPRWHWTISALVAGGAMLIYFRLPYPFTTSMPGIILGKPAGAVMLAALIDIALRAPLGAILRLTPFLYLGKISYGLYVFHVWAIWQVVQRLELAGWVLRSPSEPPSTVTYFTVLALVFTVTMIAASISFYVLERPIDRLKRRFTIVETRTSVREEPLLTGVSGSRSAIPSPSLAVERV
ncbi:acyltransferase family protein [Brucella endophytica]|uniref:acyltransferase family protein n=1 Tax=Brucella endophytica TaxID=1963359 RepID=UPI001666EBD9|nr:acyltransferase [Brucella endophytica]